MSELTKPQRKALNDAVNLRTDWALDQAFRLGMQAGQSEETAKAIKRAAEMLDLDAEELKAAHAPHGNWSGEDEAKADYDERKKVSKALRGLV